MPQDFITRPEFESFSDRMDIGLDRINNTLIDQGKLLAVFVDRAKQRANWAELLRLSVAGAASGIVAWAYHAFRG